MDSAFLKLALAMFRILHMREHIGRDADDVFGRIPGKRFAY
jgi:hypothetical protein